MVKKPIPKGTDGKAKLEARLVEDGKILEVTLRTSKKTRTERFGMQYKEAMSYSGYLGSSYTLRLAHDSRGRITRFTIETPDYRDEKPEMIPMGTTQNPVRNHRQSMLQIPLYPSLDARISEDRKTLEVQMFHPEEGLYSSTSIAPQLGIEATHLVYFTNPFNRKTIGVLYSHDETGTFRNCALVHGPRPRKLYKRIAHKTE